MPKVPALYELPKACITAIHRLADRLNTIANTKPIAKMPVNIGIAGMMLTSVALLAENPSPSNEDVRWAISGQICRCTGYQNIVNAVQRAGELMKEGS